MCRLQSSISQALNRNTLTIIVYTWASVFFYERIESETQYFIWLAGLIFGFETLINYLCYDDDCSCSCSAANNSTVKSVSNDGIVFY